MTLVSVILPTYNRADMLVNRALPSVFAQRHTDLDIHVIGDGTDQETVEAMGAITDPRVRFTNLPHQDYPEDEGSKWCVLGMDVLNYGLDHARGEWETRLADDDEFTPDHVEALLEAALSEGADVAYGMSHAIWADGSTSVYGNWPPGHFQFTDNALCRTSLGYRYDAGCLSRGLPEDGDLWDRMVEGGVKFTFVPKVLTIYHPHRQR